MSEPAIELQAVYKSFRSTEVLRGTTLQGRARQNICVSRPQRGGKTTTIRMLLGLLKRDDGAIRVLGLDPQREPLELRRRIGYLGRRPNDVRLDARRRNRAVRRAVLSDVGP